MTNIPTMRSTFDRKYFEQLCEDAVEGRLSPRQLYELEQMALEHPEALEFYTDYVAQHVALLEFFAPYRANENTVFLEKSERSRFDRRSKGFKVLWVALSLLILFLIAGTVAWRLVSPRNFMPETAGPEMIGPEKVTKDPSPGTSFSPIKDFASFTSNASTTWTDNSDALKEDNRLGPGTFRLKSGYTQIRFDHGVVMTVEAPAHLTFQSIDRCFLHSGRVVTKVSPEGVGFTIETPVAEIRDLGTEFGVSVGEGENADVQVFSGRVDVVKKNQAEIFPIESGGWLRFDAVSNGPSHAGEQFFVSPNREKEDNLHEIVCTTVEGKGREACIVSGGDVESMDPKLKSQSQLYTLLKNGVDENWHRKGYFSIDLSALQDRSDPNIRSYQDVQLELTFAPTGVGIMAFAPEVSTFSVYGLLDETEDFWSDEKINWENAPANRSGAAEVDPEKTVKIGSFEISRHEEAARIVIAGDALRRFLSFDTNHIVTFIVVRDTAEEWHSGYAHGFANKRHPQLSPPTLRFYIHSNDKKQ